MLQKNLNLLSDKNVFVKKKQQKVKKILDI